MMFQLVTFMLRLYCVLNMIEVLAERLVAKCSGVRRDSLTRSAVLALVLPCGSESDALQRDFNMIGYMRHH